MSIIVKEVNTPVLQFTTTMDDFLAFLNDQMSEETFAQQAHITHHVQWPAELGIPVASTRLGNRSWFKVDAILRPGIQTTILTERGVADIRFSLLPDAFMHLTPGTVVNVRGNIPITETSGFQGQLEDPRVDRILLHQTLRLPLEKWSSSLAGLTQFSVGRFDVQRVDISRATFHIQRVGIANETAVSLLGGLVFFKSSIALLGSSFSDLDHWLALGNARIRYPPWDLTLSITGGLFLDGDVGIATDLGRFFGNTEVGIFLRHADDGSLAGIRLGFPLTPAKELKPMYFRPRLPELVA
jgi:hypothetical protein